jgi:AbrB family looped-hinge helix DNA binding protein
MAKVTAKYQITIPSEVRRELGIVPGSDVVIVKKRDSYVLVVNMVDELKRKWRGRFEGRETTDEYMNRVRGKVS